VVSHAPAAVKCLGHETMRCGLVGKLPQKRDFVALSAPREFLRLWEPWIETSLVESQVGLDRNEWVATFATAPIWRFFLGSGLCGATVRGAFMPSVDALGRYFPLTVLAWPTEGENLAPPAEDPQWLWFESAEELLLLTLDSDVSMETIVDSLGKLGDAVAIAPPSAETQVLFLPIAAGALAQPLRQIFSAGAEHDQAAIADPTQMTFWWTLGGDERPAWAWCRKSMPNPRQFMSMLTGRAADLPQDISRMRPMTKRP
jgi:type VI secretion system protein ImpM